MFLYVIIISFLGVFSIIVNYITHNVVISDLPQRDMLAGNHASCIHNLGLDVCFDENNYHDSLQECLIEGICHFKVINFCSWPKLSEKAVTELL